MNAGAAIGAKISLDPLIIRLYVPSLMTSSKGWLDEKQL